ncbi:ribbon-helix-helix protein, CopG family [Eggerthella guodeyinii]|uniref:Ribbon-helix-helix protein, CopG family n=1 Tax=Eggerthella guodeyinii TaxID=2690837 RepID=A0A6L7IWS2_9ACTN|nr:ribbon-helix-helix protein, CopG family [Eggerthella guodeyinii]
MGRTEERKNNFKILSCEVPNSLYRKLDSETKLMRKTKSEVIRSALNHYLYSVN